jgi:hypothetical protein
MPRKPKNQNIDQPAKGAPKKKGRPAGWRKPGGAKTADLKLRLKPEHKKLFQDLGGTPWLEGVLDDAARDAENNT